MMISRLPILLFTCLLFTACTETGKYYGPASKDTTESVTTKNDAEPYQPKTGDTYYDEKELQLFCNHEITPYCLLLPLQDFTEDLSSHPVAKSQHRFVLRQDSAGLTSIEVTVFSIDKKYNYNTAFFYKRDKRNIEQGGLGIDTAFIDEANHLYLVKGYLPNYTNIKFVQLNWILDNRIAVYINYDEKEEALWKFRIAAIIKRGVTYNH